MPGLSSPPSHTSQRHSLLANSVGPFTPESFAYCRFGIMNGASIFPSVHLVQKGAMGQNVSSLRVHPVYPYVAKIGISLILPDIAENIVSSLTLPSPIITRRHSESAAFLPTAPAAVGAYWSLPRYAGHWFKNPNPSVIACHNRTARAEQYSSVCIIFNRQTVPLLLPTPPVTIIHPAIEWQ